MDDITLSGELYVVKMRQGLITILNVDLSDDRWLQASVPVDDGGLVVRSAQMLAPSAFLSSAESTLVLQQAGLRRQTSNCNSNYNWKNVTGVTLRQCTSPPMPNRISYTTWSAGAVVAQNKSDKVCYTKLRADISSTHLQWKHWAR